MIDKEIKNEIALLVKLARLHRLPDDIKEVCWHMHDLVNLGHEEALHYFEGLSPDSPQIHYTELEILNFISNSVYYLADQYRKSTPLEKMAFSQESFFYRVDSLKKSLEKWKWLYKKRKNAND